MAKCCTDCASGSNRLWTPSFRKRLFEVIACGAGGGIRFGTCSSRRRRGTCGDKWKQEIGMAGSDEKDYSGSEKDVGKKVGSEKLSDFLNISCTEKKTTAEDRDSRRKKAEDMKRVVTMLTGGADEREKIVEAASEIRRLAKDDSSARSLLAFVGAIPPLVGMIDSESDDASKIAALYALLNLGIGNDLNKAAIVKAGAVHKMLNLITQGPMQNLGSAVSEAIVANFLGLSALDSNKSIIGSSGAITFLVKLLNDKDSRSSVQSRQDSLRALYNLTIYHSNVLFVLETDLIEYLMNVMGDMEVSERGLAILSNVVSIPEGRKAISAVPDTFQILVDVLNWTDAPGCQEKATYILMVMSHKAYGDRRAIVDAGVVSALLELTLLGTTLAQKRASRILEFLRVDKGKQISESFSNVNISASAPLYCSASSASSGMQPTPMEQSGNTNLADDTSTEKKAVKQLVQQSLQNNMRRIIKRANLPNDYVPSDHFKSLTLSSTSKSLPF